MNENLNAPFDEMLEIERRKRAINQHGDSHFLMEHCLEEVRERLATVARSFSTPVTIFCGGSTAAEILQERSKAAGITQLEADADLLGAPKKIKTGKTGSPARLGLQPGGHDLAVSLLAMHSINDLTGFLIQSRLCLKPDGLFLGCLFGAGTLQELREVLFEAETQIYGGVSPRIAPFADVRDMGGLLQRAGFALPVADSETLNVRYSDIFALIRDLRAMGLTNVLNERSRKPLSRAFWAKAAALYESKFSDHDGRIRATFSVIWVSGWAPSPSQSKALKPGSATVSLKDVL